VEKNSILYLLKSQDLEEKKLDLFREKLKDKNFTLEDCDTLLRKLGYSNIFTFQSDSERDIEDEHIEFERIKLKKGLADE